MNLQRLAARFLGDGTGRLHGKRQRNRIWGVRCRPALEDLEARALLTGTWTPLSNLMPNGDWGSGSGAMMLLSNGTVMVQGGGDQAPSSRSDYNNWYQLTPDQNGNFVNGTWSKLAPMDRRRFDYASVVLPDGRVMVLGGEYSGPALAQNWTNECEIYDPSTNTWTVVTPVANGNDTQYGDEPVMVFSDGIVMTPDGNNTNTYLYDPKTDTWTNGPNRLFGVTSYEENWVKLRDGSVLAVPTTGNNLREAQRYVLGSTHAADRWIDSGTLPQVLAWGGPDNGDAETGPAVLLPDGRVWQIGGNNHTAIYTPPPWYDPLGTGSWIAGPDIPNDDWGNMLTGADVSAAMMPNGKVLFTASPWLVSPTSIFEFDPNANGGKGAITPAWPGPSNIAAWYTTMLVLPTGQVLYNQRYTGQLWVYTPDGKPDPAWKPTIRSITRNKDGTFLLKGTQLNGMSEGGYFGDDAETSSNYPIVRLRDKKGRTFFATTSHWSSTGVQTGKKLVSTLFSLSGVPVGHYKLQVIASGIASRGVRFAVRANPASA